MGAGRRGSLLRRPPVLYLIANLRQAARLGAGVAGLARAVRQRSGPEELTLLFQLRDPHATAKELFEAASAWTGALAEHSAYLLVNERVDVAVTAGALGVHLSRESYLLGEARRLMPEGTLAYSAHTAAEAEAAALAGADLVTLSPIFASPEKGAPLGLSALEDAVRCCREVPVLALGGIRAENLSEAVGPGAAGVALIRSVLEASDPERAAAGLAANLTKLAK